MHRWFAGAMLGTLLLILAACGGGSTPEPTAIPSPTAAPTATPAPTDAPTPTAAPSTPAAEPTTASAAEPAPAGEAAVVDFWTSDNEPKRVAVYRALAERYMAGHPGVTVNVVPYVESTTLQQLEAAQAAGDLPDLIRVGIEWVAALDGAGLLDPQAAGAVVQVVGETDFREGVLAMVTDVASGEVLAVPYDGWIQALWYRRDRFEQLGLKTPISWADLNQACDAIEAGGDPAFALVLPTVGNQNYVHQVFEQVAMSNNVWPFDAAGNVTMNTPEMVEALRFYAGLQRCSPDAPQDLYGARERYERDESAMLFYSTYIMDDLIEGSDNADGTKIEIAVENLPGKTGFTSSLAGPNGVASYGQLVTLALLDGASPAAQDVARFFLQEGYLDILATAPLGKVPVLDSALEPWSTSSPIFQAYSPATLGHIANGYATMKRWVLRPEYDRAQKATIGAIEARLIIPAAIEQIVLGDLTPEAAAQQLQAQVEDLYRVRKESGG
ncbi:MAG: carbohydrate ABC transporter substrate-binding protein [Caldilinea sp.]|nr:carbohydrate ABC transporter substrate-binding protein [Caldilinea sp.]MCB0038248.1 carbohydrate ABC transporter substrate-binding protein [Caldilinea sp.]MCB9116360.1 carbohydrate ABC transporter substrate-binding protein [Caldilineaceae bacterium]MCB9122668.1 carbohydrate ABC transporter substrate-binding protein [Caldilineaceae bacterium]MCB9125436.1 carbohydrate ABC transporter substrate-binding protein [Caldilineaceae bacterium]